MNTDKQQVIKTVLDKYFQKEITFPAEQIDAVQSFFLKRGFDETPTRSLTIVLLNQALIDQVDVFQLLDKLKGLTDIQLTQVITDVLNAYRDRTSILGFKQSSVDNTLELRNILV